MPGLWPVLPCQIHGLHSCGKAAGDQILGGTFHFHCCPAIYLTVGAAVAGRPELCVVSLAAPKFSGMAGRAAAIRSPRLQALPLLSPRFHLLYEFQFTHLQMYRYVEFSRVPCFGQRNLHGQCFAGCRLKGRDRVSHPVMMLMLTLLLSLLMFR